MSPTRKYNQWSASSPLCRVPEILRNRCSRAGCQGSDCPVWRKCGPATPFGSYGSHLTALPVLVGKPGVAEAPVASA